MGDDASSSEGEEIDITQHAKDKMGDIREVFASAAIDPDLPDKYAALRVEFNELKEQFEFQKSQIEAYQTSLDILQDEQRRLE